MPGFAYTALGEGGRIETGEIAADSREAAIAALRGQGIVPLKVEPQAAARRQAAPFARLFRRRRASERDLMLFTRELRLLLSAGLPIDRALGRLDRILSDGPMARVPGEILAALRGGSSLGAALARRGDVFPPYYLGMVRAGEAGGFLVEVLGRLATMLERSAALGAKVRAALAYPMLVLALTGLSLVVLLVYVVPEFRTMLEDTGTDLPVATRVVFAVSGVVNAHGHWLALAAVAGLLALRSLRLSGEGRMRIDRWLIGAPVLGPLIRRIETTRFCRILGTLRANGVPLVEAVRIAAGTLSNAAFREALGRSAEPLARGEGLTRPLRATGLLPDLALQLVEIGEESGQLDQMLVQVADVFDEEVERSLQQALALLAPLVTVFLGILIALIIGSILGAILSSYEIRM